MKRRQRICILGNTLMLNGLGVSLRKSGCFDLTSMELPGDARVLEHLQPDAILFDLAALRTESVFSLSANGARRLLIGVSPGSYMVKVWTGQQLRELRMADLMAMIQAQGQDTVSEASEGEKSPFGVKAGEEEP